MACRLAGTKPLSEQMLVYYWLDIGTKFNEILIEIHIFSFKKVQAICNRYDDIKPDRGILPVHPNKKIFMFLF